MTLNEFITKYSGQTKGYPTDSSYKGECLSIVKLYIQEKYGFPAPPSGSNSAYGYWSNFPHPLSNYFTKIANSPTNFPKQGDIVIWNTKVGNGYGHIAIVTKADQNSFESFEQNWGGKHAHLVTHNYQNVVGWLTPKEVEMPDCDEIRKARDDHWNRLSLIIRAVLGSVELTDQNIDEQVKKTIERFEKSQDLLAKEVQAHKKTSLANQELREINLELADKLVKCESSVGQINIDPAVKVAGIDWEINGVEIDSQGVVRANYRKK